MKRKYEVRWYECNLTEEKRRKFFALWCTNYILQIGLTEYRRICNRYEELKSEAQVVMSIQAELIKELTDKLDGKDSKDSADSGAGVVAEESLQAHEE